MGKRKRDAESPASAETSDDRKRAKLRTTITTGIARLTIALETARRFERQKLGKRQHDKRNDVDGRKINIEIAVLKSLDMTTVAKQKVHKNLVKTTSIAKTGLLPEDVVLPATGALDKTMADLMARLFKQRGVGEALDATMMGVRQVLGLQANGAGKKVKQENGAEKSNGVAEGTGKELKAKQQLVEKHELRSSAPKPVLAVSDSEEEFKGFSSRVASSSDEGTSESESEDESDDDLRVPRTRHSRLASISISGSDSEPESDREADRKPKSKAATRPPPTSSAFLPSLSMGGYMSNSDSDATDVEDHIAPRKNRRGQRARQAIWEKKFKTQAKHLKDPPKNNSKKDKRGDGWDAQRGAVDKSDRRGGFGKRDRGPSAGNAAPLGEKKEKREHRDDGGSLHPSWEAKKNAKQMTAGIGGFKGKKMTFD
jgi:hypothetical protein